MCGRVTQKSGPNRLGLGLVTVDPAEPLYNLPPRYNGAPGQEHWVIRQHPKTGERSLDRLWWGLIPHWCKDAGGGRKPINAKGETVAALPSFRDAYRKRRCLLPVDNFFEWKAIKGEKAKQPFAIAMKSGKPLRSPRFGRTGKNREPKNGCAALRLSPRPQMSSSRIFTSACL